MPRRPLAAALAVLLLTALAGWGLVRQGERLRLAERRLAAATLASSTAWSVEQQLARSLSATYALAALVRHQGELPDFDALAAQMLPIYGGLSSLQLAPGAVIRHIYPLAGNEAALGHDLLADPDRRFQARQAIDSRQLVVAGPFTLKQGGTGLVGRLAVYRPAADGERLWGLVTAVVKVDDLLAASQVPRLAAAGYGWRLTREEQGGAGPACFAGCEATVAEPITFPIEVPGGRWTLEVAPLAGWSSGGRPWLEYGAVAIAALVLALLSFQVARQPARLQAEVAARTAELQQANQRLAEDMARRHAAEASARAAEEQLRQSQKMEAIGQLAGGIAHDFNNLLTGILGHASALLEAAPAGSEAHEAAATITEAGRRAAELTRQLLSVARRTPSAAAPFDAHGVAREVQRLLDRTLEERIRLRLDLRAEASTVVGDAGQLQQALLNLAVNARDAMPGGGELTIGSSVVARDADWCARHPGAQAGRFLAIAVKDTGTGIPRPVLDRIFEPFFTTKEPGRGTGMGLATVYGVARNHGGGVEVETADGLGTTFTLSLPLAPEGVALGAASAARSPRRGSGRVLVVDDDAIPRETAATILRALGYEVVTATGGAEAVEWLRAHPGPLRAALLDVAMPGMDGVACEAALRALDPGLRVVLTSGYDRDERARDLLARGAVGFVAKPYGAAELAEAISRA